MQLTIIAKNIRFYRRQLGQTQQQFADSLGIKRSLLGAYEEGRAMPKLEVLSALAELFKCGIADLINKELAPEGAPIPMASQRGRPAKATPISLGPIIPEFPTSAPSYIPSPTASRGWAASQEATIAGRHIRTLATTTTEDGMPLVEMVTKADAPKYLKQFDDLGFLIGLQKMALPFLQAGGSYRTFQLQADGFVGYAVAQFVRNWYMLTAKKSYVVVHNGGIEMAQLENKMADALPSVTLLSKGKTPRTIGLDSVLEFWEVEWLLADAGDAHTLPKQDQGILPERISLQLEQVSQRLSAIEASLSMTA